MRREGRASLGCDVVLALASAFRAGPWERGGLVFRGAIVLGGRPRWLRQIVIRVMAENELTPDREDLRDAIARAAARIDVSVVDRRTGERLPPRIRTVIVDEVTMGARQWPVPEVATVGALSEWLGLDAGELDWFADRRGFAATSACEPIRHYRYRWIPKRSGGIRLLEIPKARLRDLQRRIAVGILAAIPPHDAAVGFRRGRSIMDHARPHAGRRAVLRMDLEDCFTSVYAPRVYGTLRVAGYPREVARTLTALTTHATPPATVRTMPRSADVDANYRARQRFATPHLPQGSPSSPVLANLALYRLDLRLHAAAARAGARYTRYADDLAFSGEAHFARSAARFAVLATAIAYGESMRVAVRKTRLMRASVRQSLCGVTVNAKPNLARPDYDRLKAILHDAINHGPTAANREAHADFRAHLAGRIAHAAFLNPSRAARLQVLFARIAW